MWPATAWTDDDWNGERARGWTVTRALEARPRRQLRLADDAQQRIEQRSGMSRMMTATSWIQDAEDEALARDLFFHGYYRSSETANFEKRVGASPAGRGYLGDW